MDFETYDCDRCGGNLTAIDSETYKCQYCGKIFHKKEAEEQTKTFRDMFDEMKREHINNLRRNLYDAVNAEYISSFDVKMRCEELKKYLPDDFSACFYEVAVGNNVRQLTKYIRKIDVEKNYDEIECVVKFLIKSLQTEYQLELNNLIARAYEKRDPERFERFCTMLSNEAVKVDGGVYETKLPREVFIAYSSKDMEKVSELCEFLESQGLKCFVAARNLRHGKGAVENYNKALEEAMDHCKCVVFVSSMNSRNFNCDALIIELPYIQQKDIDAAPAEYKNNYKGMPQEYKKPRVEYRIGESLSSNVADAISNEIFDGYERVYSPDEVAQRVMKQLVALNDRKNKKTDIETKIVYTDSAEDAKQRIEQILNRARKSMEEGEWSVAESACERALDVDTECAEAYVLKLMIDYRVANQEDLANSKKTLDGNVNYNKAVKYADDELKTALCRYDNTIKERIENKKRAAKKKVKKAITATILSCVTVTIVFVAALLLYMHVTYSIAMNDFKEGKLEKALDMFDRIPEYQNSSEMIAYCEFALGDAEPLRNYIITNSLSEFVIPHGVTSIGDYAFYNCSSLTSIVIPDGVTSIGTSAFSGCDSLTSIVIPDGVTSIGGVAFSGCSSLDSVVIPVSVTNIGVSAFYSCADLNTIYYTGSEAQWKQIKVKDYNSPLYSATIVYNYSPEGK